LEALPDARAAHAELARETEQHGDLLERGARARAVAREHVHQIDVPPMEAVQIVVEAELAIRVAELPEARRRDTVAQRAIVQHGQVEAAAVPRDELGQIVVEPVEEALHELLLGRRRIADREDAYAVAAAQPRRA